MNDPKDKDGASDDDLTAEIRRGRPFSLAEAVGREAAGALKGASPVPAADQLVLAIDDLLDRRLDDPEGSLRRTILARLADDAPLLARHFGAAPAALREFLDRVLGSPTALDDLVRRTDARWGRDYGEKPRFETGDGPAHPDDPYTRAGVAARLAALRDTLTD